MIYRHTVKPHRTINPINIKYLDGMNYIVSGRVEHFKFTGTKIITHIQRLASMANSVLSHKVEY